MRLKNKVAIVTGAASGLGEAISKMFLNEGAQVVLSDINDYPEIKNLGDSAFFFRADVSQKKEIEDLINFTLEKFSRIDIMVNNAGISLAADLLNTEGDAWDKVLNINSKGVFYGTQLVAKYMKESNIKGSIINTSSVLGIRGSSGSLAYSASKGAIDQVTRSAALDLASSGIRVNAIAPGIIETGMTREMKESEYFKDLIKKTTPLGRMGEPQDIAYAAVYLASDESKFVTGSILRVDGGWTAQ